MNTFNYLFYLILFIFFMMQFPDFNHGREIKATSICNDLNVDYTV